MAALIPIFLANLPTLIKAGEAVAGYVSQMHEAMSQSEEWTPEIEAHYQDQLKNDGNLPQWQPDAA